MTITLDGMTWDHPRGRAPLERSIERYRRERPDVAISWTARSLKDFGELPLEALAERFDLIVFDHPFVGQAAKRGLLADLTPHIPADAMAWLDAGAVGPSWRSYHWQGGIYGLPIDAAAQVAAYRPDLMARAQRQPPATFDQLLQLARDLRSDGLWVGVPAVPIDAMCMVITLAANLGRPVPTDRAPFLEREFGLEVIERVRELVSLSHPASTRLNPIQMLDLAATSDEVAYIPYTFGYTNYCRPGVDKPLRFADIVAAGNVASCGTLLGGAGFGVTTRCRNVAEAVRYGLWLCAPDYQRTHYFDDGGQPGMLQAWTDPALDAQSDGFFSGTLRTLSSAYLRPRFAGYVPFFEEGGLRTNAFLRGESSAGALVDWLNDAYAAALRAN
ncbi:ABC transporter substrate-binding protein [Bosea sp. (in: a-proteobacteria)]|uniref:ABC transporter substrate-binding protein n=1 Tax=Bosea sp. (in: a-proteobacteria) TaxID=1871050 RepID=UPI003F71025A